MTKIKINRNRGLDLQKEIRDQQPTDYIFGVGEPLSGLAESIPFKKYLPIGEIQQGKGDTMDCATRAPINILETKFTYLYQNRLFNFEKDTGFMENAKWLEDKGYIVDGRVVFSDAFVAIGSKTTKQGNSLIAPIDFIHRGGLIPKPMCPLESWMRWEDYHNPKRITKEMLDLGLEFLTRFTISYERVINKDFNLLINKDMIDVAGHAWPVPDSKGEYPRTGYPFNHAFVYFEKPPYEIFDNYPDVFDRDFIKNLASNYSLMSYGYRLIVNEIDVKKKMSRATLEKLYQLGFHRGLDDGALNHLNFKEEQVLDAMISSEESEKIGRVLEWMKGNSFWKVFLPSELKGIADYLKNLERE